MMCFLVDPARGWSQPEVIAQVALAIFTLATLIYFLWSFQKTLADAYYASLDTMYFELLKIAMERPYLANPESLPTEKQGEYDAYAFMVWNFVETIFDRCEKDKKLRTTWYPVLDCENDRHRKWFDEQVNRDKFKQSFQDFIDNRHPRQQQKRTAKSGQQGT